MADIALFAPHGTFHASLGACLDAFSLVRGQVERVLSAQDTMHMETRLRLLTEDGRPARLADGRMIGADDAIGGSEPYGLVHLAAFRVGSPDALNDRLTGSTKLFAWLHQMRDRGALMSASGSAIFLLAEAGFLDGISAPLPRALIPLGRARFPRLRIDQQQGIVEHDRIILGSGLAAEAAHMVRLVERSISPEMGRWLASVMGTDRRDEGRLAHDVLVSTAQLWLEERFTQAVRIGDLAAAMSTNQQTLIRHFRREIGMTPRDYLQHVRVEAAQRMLRLSRRTIEQIAGLIGYRDARSFRAVFRERVGMSATAYREQMAAREPDPESKDVLF